MESTAHFPHGEVLAFTVRDGRLIAFHDLASLTNPFAVVANPLEAKRHTIHELFADPDKTRWVI